MVSIYITLFAGGLAGIAGNDILTMIGEDVLNGHKVMGGMKGGKRK